MGLRRQKAFELVASAAITSAEVDAAVRAWLESRWWWWGCRWWALDEISASCLIHAITPSPGRPGYDRRGRSE